MMPMMEDAFIVMRCEIRGVREQRTKDAQYLITDGLGGSAQKTHAVWSRRGEVSSSSKIARKTLLLSVPRALFR